MSVLMEDVLRQKVMAKVEDDNFIFIRRAVDVKSRARLDKKAAQRARMGSEVPDYVNNPMTNVDFEEKYESEKRNKQAVKKLIHLKTTRMLEIIGYTTTESDVRRLEYAINQFGKVEKVFKRSNSMPPQEDISMQSFFGTGSEKLEEKIMQLGLGLPKLDADLHKMQFEMQMLVQSYGDLQKIQSG